MIAKLWVPACRPREAGSGGRSKVGGRLKIGQIMLKHKTDGRGD